MEYLVRNWVSAILLLILCGCAYVGPAKAEIACDVWPKYPELSPKDVSTERLVALIEENTAAQFMIASRSAADRLENFLRNNAGKIVDIEQVFYENQIDFLAEICSKDEDGSSVVPAATIVARMSAALVHAAGLGNAPDHLVDAVIPSARQNLTAKANILFLVASCSGKSHPRLMEGLKRMGLRCAN